MFAKMLNKVKGVVFSPSGSVVPRVGNCDSIVSASEIALPVDTIDMDTHCYQVVIPDETYALTYPDFCNHEAVIDPVKHKRMLDNFALSSRVVPQCGVFHFCDAIVAGQGVVAVNQCVLRETLHQITPDTVNYTLHEAGLVWKSVPDVKTISEPAVLLRKAGDGNYGHWITEIVPKLQLLAGMAVADLRFIIPDNPALYGLYRDSLAMAGVEESQLLAMNDETLLLCRHLIYPSPMSHHPVWKSPRVISYLEALQSKSLSSMASSDMSSPEKLFVSREDGCIRQVVNKYEVLGLVKSLGYQVVETGGLSFMQQMQLFHKAKDVVGIFGASMTNMVFAPRGARVTLLCPDYVPGLFYWDIACHKQQIYNQLHGLSVNEHRMNDDFIVDIEQLSRLLKGAAL